MTRTAGVCATMKSHILSVAQVGCFIPAQFLLSRCPAVHLYFLCLDKSDSESSVGARAALCMQFLFMTGPIVA